MNKINEKLSNFFFFENSFPLRNHKVFEFVGDETRDYLQRQLTADLNDFNESAGLSCRLDRSGRVFSFFYLINESQKFYIVVDEKLAARTKEDLEKFIIMEDIVINEIDMVANISTKKKQGYVPVTIFDGNAFIGIEKSACESTVSNQDLYDLMTLSAWPTSELNIKETDLVNETRLNEYAVSYKKGCFLGQETAAKIESRRGAARFPVLIESPIKIDDEIIEIEGKKISILSRTRLTTSDLYFYSCKAPREFLINELDISYNHHNLKVYTYPVADLSVSTLSETYFNKAVELFHQKKIDEALNLLDLLIVYNPSYADAYETKGVILGNSGKHEEAIKVMDELLKVDENSVMAHTNKSLYLMKLGKIEEAEEEKAQATVASFKRFGDEASAKRAKEEQERAEKEDRARRFEMFNKVLAIDEVDVVANYGLADIHFNNENYDKATKHIETVLKENPKYSVAYLLKSKILFKQKKYDECLEVVEKGIPVATSQGELMPANEMQSLKAKLSRL